MDRDELIKRYERLIEKIDRMINLLWTEPGSEQKIIELRDRRQVYKTFISELKLLK
jgi:hypothetical protein